MANMRTLAWVSTGFAVLAGIVAANLWRQLHDERELTDALRSQLAGAVAGQARAPHPATGGGAVPAVPPRIDAPPAATSRETDYGEQELLEDPEYRKARLQADGYAAALAQAGVPLDGAQTRAIAMALRDEQKSLKQDIVALARTVDLSIPRTQQEAQHALARRQAESGRRVLDAVYPVLGAQQTLILRDQFEQEARRAAASAQESSR